MARDNTSRIRTTRRRLVETTGLGGAAVVAGCLGDDEEPVDDVDADGVDDVDDVDDTDPADDTDDVDDVVEEADDADGNDEIEEEIERYDVAPFLVRNPPMPGDVQYHRRGWDVEPLPSWIGFGGLEFSPMTRSFAAVARAGAGCCWLLLPWSLPAPPSGFGSCSFPQADSSRTRPASVMPSA